MHESGCEKEATQFEEDQSHWHDYIWCEEHAIGKQTIPLKSGKEGFSGRSLEINWQQNLATGPACIARNK
jgi:hypothetical protein